MAKVRLFDISLQYGTITLYNMGIDAQQHKYIDISNVFR